MGPRWGWEILTCILPLDLFFSSRYDRSSKGSGGVQYRKLHYLIERLMVSCSAPNQAPI